MATIAEMFIDIGADATQFERETQKMQSDMKGMQKELSGMAASMGTSSAQMGRDWQHMSNEMQSAFKAAQDKLKPFKQAQQEVQYEFFKMSQSMKDYQGTNNDFMNDVEALGRKQKKVTEDMMKNNEMLKMSYIQNVGAILARSTQSEKIAANFERMNNPLYSVNNGLLKISHRMEEVAKRGQPAALALQMLGPTANMKELNDMMRLITAGLMRYQMVVLAALVVNALFFAGLHKAAMNSVPAYKEAFEEMGASVRKAFQPMVDVFAAVMTPIFKFITLIADLVIKFNEAHPLLAKIIQGFLMLIPLLTLILAPLAIGIGLWAGMQAAFASTWMLIGPLVTGLAAMMGTVLLVAAAIAVLVGGFVYLWKTNEDFKNGVIAIWNSIKAAAIATWNYIYTNGIKPAIDAISLYVTSVLNRLKAFWQLHGEQIMQIVSIAMTLIKGTFSVQLEIIKTVFQVAFLAIKTTVSVIFQAIKAIIDIILNTIGGLFKFWAAVFKGDWQGAFDAIKGIVTDNLNTVVDFIKGLGSTFFNAGKGLIEMMAKGIESAASKVLSTVKELAGKVRDFLPFSPAKTGPLSDLDHLDFGGPISDSIDGAIPKVQRLMSNMLTMPSIGGPGNIAAAAAGGDTYEVNVTLHADDINQMQSIYEFFDTFKQVKRSR